MSFQYGIYFFLMAALQLLPSYAEQEELHLFPSNVAQLLLAPYQTITPQDPSETQLSSIRPNKFAPYTVDPWAPTKEGVLIPAWVPKVCSMDKKEATLEFFLPPLSEQTESPTIDTFFLTVVFYDTGDGGPRIEWKNKKNEKKDEDSHIESKNEKNDKKDEDSHIESKNEKDDKGNSNYTYCICEGLGVQGPPIGLNSRTIQIQTKEKGFSLRNGGTLIIRHTGRLRHIVSASIRPARFTSESIAVLGKKIVPAIIDESLNVTEKEIADGDSFPTFKKGHQINGNLVTTVLSEKIEHFELNEKGEEILSKSIELTKHPKATLLYTDLQGLDLTSSIDVELNGTFVGRLNTSFFRLDAPQMLLKTATKATPATFELAGWQRAHLFIPPHLWKENNESNDLLFTIKKGPNAVPTKVHIKNMLLQLLY